MMSFKKIAAAVMAGGLTLAGVPSAFCCTGPCLFYTTDAADERTRGDLGGGPLP